MLTGMRRIVGGEFSLQFVASFPQSGAQLPQRRALDQTDSLAECQFACLRGGRRVLHEMRVQLGIELEVGALVRTDFVVVGGGEDGNDLRVGRWLNENQLNKNLHIFL